MLTADKLKLIRYAAKGDIINLRFMLQIADPTGWDSHALKVAAENGRTECVLALMGRCNPKSRRSAALVAAAKNNHHDCVRLLAPVSDLEAVAWQLKRPANHAPHNPLGLVAGVVRKQRPNDWRANQLFKH